jgi:hypothetical protein
MDKDNFLTDIETGSKWNWNGECVSGHFAGKKLTRLTAYQTYYHAWNRFYSNKYDNTVYFPDQKKN